MTMATPAMPASGVDTLPRDSNTLPKTDSDHPEGQAEKASQLEDPSPQNPIPKKLLPWSYKSTMAWLFSSLFYGIAFLLLCTGVYQLVVDLFTSGQEVINIVIRVINTLVIALAMFELGAGISKEYSNAEENSNIYTSIRRTITRFVGTVCIALVLESLMMVIKYSQLEMAGNLYYPVAIMVGASLMLISLGGFLALTRDLKN